MGHSRRTKPITRLTFPMAGVVELLRMARLQGRTQLYWVKADGAFMVLDKARKPNEVRVYAEGKDPAKDGLPSRNLSALGPNHFTESINISDIEAALLVMPQARLMALDIFPREAEIVLIGPEE
jgi:hypothetical protein